MSHEINCFRLFWRAFLLLGHLASGVHGGDPSARLSALWIQNSQGTGSKTSQDIPNVGCGHLLEQRLLWTDPSPHGTVE